MSVTKLGPPTCRELMAAAMAHLRAQHDAARGEAIRRNVQLTQEDANWNPIPLAVYWSLLPQYTVHFFGFKETAADSLVRYIFVPNNGVEFEYSETSPFEAPGRHGWSQRPVLIFDSELWSNPQRAEVLEAKARIVLNQHLSVRGFFRKLTWIEDLAAVTKHVRETGTLIGGRQVDPETYYRMCIVLVLGALETLLHDVFYTYQDDWFHHVPEGRKRNKAMRGTVRRLGSRREWRSEWRRIKNSPDLWAATMKFLRPAQRSRISFQDMRSSRTGAKWAYKAFFGIALPAMVERAEKDTWTTFMYVADQRQETLHPGQPEQVTREQVNRALDKVRKAQCALLQETMTRATGNSAWRL